MLDRSTAIVKARGRRAGVSRLPDGRDGRDGPCGK